MMRLRSGNMPASGSRCMGDSVTSAPAAARGGDLRGQFAVFRRIDLAKATRENRKRASATGKRATMSTAVNAPGETRHDGPAGAGQIVGNALGDAAAIVRAGARADDADAA